MGTTTILGTGPSTDDGAARGAAHERKVGRGRALRLAAAVLAIGVGLSGARTAWADDAATLLADGKKLLKEKGKTAEACAKMEESQRLSPSATTLYQVANCHEKQGKIATAFQEFIDTEAEARKAGNKKVQADAKGRSAMLELKVPRVTVKVPAGVEGFELKVDGVAVDKSAWNQAMPIDPGEHKLGASAPGKKGWEGDIKIKTAERKTVTVPALEDDPNGAAAAAATPKAAPKAAPAPGPTKPAGPAAPPPQPEEPPEPEVTTHQAGRLVLDIGAGPMGMLGIIEAGSVSTIRSYDYVFTVPNGFEQIAVCDEDICTAIYDPSLGVVIGGEAFFGYALEEDLHVGARVFGGYRFGGGYVLVGGPAGALKVDPVWLGLSLVIGGVAQDAPVVGIKGQIPEEFRSYNKGQEEVDVPTAYKTPLPETEVVGTLAFGAAIEISYPLIDMPSGKWSSGALMVSAWPTFMKGIEGFVITLPIMLNYRFY